MSSARTLLLFVVLFTSVGPAWAVAPQAVSPEGLRGAWRPVSYELEGGPTHRVDGSIVFTERDWSVVFFVVGEDGEPRFASAEGGTYALEGDRLTFTHRFNFSGFAPGAEVRGLAPRDLRMSIVAGGAGESEPTTIAIDSGRLTIDFPSGNRMSFIKTSEDGR